MDIACGLILLLPGHFFPFLMQKVFFLLSSPTNSSLVCILASFLQGKSLGQDCRSSWLHNSGAQRQKMQFPHRYQCVLTLRPCRSMVQPCVSVGAGRQPWAGLHPLQWWELLHDVLELSCSVLCRLGPDLQQRVSAVSGQLMQLDFSMAAYLLPPLIPEVGPFQPRQELPLSDTHMFPSSCRRPPESLRCNWVWGYFVLKDTGTWDIGAERARKVRIN